MKQFPLETGEEFDCVVIVKLLRTRAGIAGQLGPRPIAHAPGVRVPPRKFCRR